MLRATLVAIGVAALFAAVISVCVASPGDFLLSALLIALILRHLQLKAL